MVRMALSPDQEGGWMVQKTNNSKAASSISGTGKRVRILIVEDDSVDRKQIRRCLETSAMAVEVDEASTISAGVAALKAAAYDLVILDHILPDGSGIDMIRQLRQSELEIPVIVTTGYGSELLVVELLRAGAFDYIPKDQITADILYRSVARAVRVRTAEQQVYRQDRLLQGIGRAATRLLSVTDLRAAVSDALAFLGSVTGVDRICVFEHVSSPSGASPSAVQRFEWARGDEILRLSRKDAAGFAYADAGLQRWDRILHEGGVINGPVRNLPDPEKKRFEKEGVCSLLVVPVRVEEAFWGFVEFDDCHTERQWTQSEESVLSATAAGIGGALVRKQAEEAMRISEEKYRNFIENLNLGVFRNSVDEGGAFLQVNQAHARILGYSSAQELQGKHILDCYQDPSERKALLDEIRHNGYVRDRIVRLKKKDGTPIYASITAHLHLGETGEEEWIEGVIEDVTERKMAQEEVRRARDELERRVAERTVELEKLKADLEKQVVARTEELTRVNERLRKARQQQQALLDSIPDIAWLKDPDSRFIAVNKALGKACERDPEDLVGKTDLDIWPKELAELYMRDDQEVLKTGKSKRIEEPLAVYHAGRVWIETVKVPILDESGHVVGTAGLARDITGRKRIEAERQKLAVRLLDVQEDERKKISAMLHDHLGQLLTLARLDLGSLRVRSAASKKIITNTLRRLDEMLQSIRDMAISLRPPLLDDLGIEAALETLTEEIADEPGLTTSFARKGPKPQLGKTVETALYRVLQEALTNAVKHSGARRIDVTLETDKKETVLKVRDNGKGLAADQLETTKGIGLVGMRERLVQCGGHLDIQSVEGKGATIIARVPSTGLKKLEK